MPKKIMCNPELFEIDDWIYVANHLPTIKQN